MWSKPHFGRSRAICVFAAHRKPLVAVHSFAAVSAVADEKHFVVSLAKDANHALLWEALRPTAVPPRKLYGYAGDPGAGAAQSGDLRPSRRCDPRATHASPPLTLALVGPAQFCA